MEIISIIICCVFFVTVFTLIILDDRKEREINKRFTSPEIFHKLNEIYDMEELGICDSCEYGINKCLSEGQAYCKHNKKKEITNETLDR